MSELRDLLLTGVLNHGALALGTVLFLAALGIPLPATVLLIAAGAFVQQGVLAPESAVVAASIGAVSGDGGSYLLGRFGAALLPLRMQTSDPWKRAARLFERWGSWGVFFTRFLLTPAALPVNLLAGSTRFPVRRFAPAVMAGQLLWVALFGGAGYMFADRWEDLSSIAGDSAAIALGVVLATWGLIRLRQGRGGPI